MRLKVFLITLFFLFVFSLFLHTSFAIEIPSYEGFVNDNEGVIDNVDELEQKIADFEKATSIEIAVLTTPDFSETYIEDYAVRVFEAWGIGKKGLDNGVLIVVSKEQRQSRIEVGYGLEGVLTDSLTGRIQDSSMIPSFKEEKYSEGINRGIDSIMKTLEGEEFEREADSESGDIFGSLISIGIMLAFFMLFVANDKVAAAISGITMLVFASLLLGSFMSGLMWGIILSLIGAGMSRLGQKIPKTEGTNSSRRGSGGPFSGSSSWGGGSSGGGGFGGGSSGGGGSSRSW